MTYNHYGFYVDLSYISNQNKYVPPIY